MYINGYLEIINDDGFRVGHVSATKRLMLQFDPYKRPKYAGVEWNSFEDARRDLEIAFGLEDE